ncbi:hypothetical protein COOONC_06595 [Cooperia oncophora]
MKQFVTIGPTVVVPSIVANDGVVVWTPPATVCEVAVRRGERYSPDSRKTSTGISGSCVSYEGEIISPENSCGGLAASVHAKSSSSHRGNFDHSDAHVKRSRPRAMSKSPSPKRKRRTCPPRTTCASDARSCNERISSKGRSSSSRNRDRRAEANHSARDRRSRPGSDRNPDQTSARKRRAETTSRTKRDTVNRSRRRVPGPVVNLSEAKSPRRLKRQGKVEVEQRASRQGASRRSSRNRSASREDEKGESAAVEGDSVTITSCTLLETVSAPEESATVSCDLNSGKRDVILEQLSVEVDPQATMVTEERERTPEGVDPDADGEHCTLESLSSAWKDSDFVYEDYDLLTPRHREMASMEFNVVSIYTEDTDVQYPLGLLSAWDCISAKPLKSRIRLRSARYTT